METRAKCHACGSLNLELKEKQTYHFTESGLDNVYLTNVDIHHCPDCMDDFLLIPRPLEILDCIAWAILKKPRLLSGPEIRFLRKNRFMNTAEFAELIGHARVSLSRWENGQRKVSNAADRAIRLAYLANSDLKQKMRQDLIRQIRKEFSSDVQTSLKFEYTVRFPFKESLSCEVRSSAA